MPPWHIDRSVGVQKFKNDMSLSDEQVDTIVRWVDQGAPQGNPADMPPPRPVSTALYWQAEKDGFGPPDIIVKSGEQTMPALHQDEWWRPLVDIPGLTEPRWAKIVEIRPSNIKGRKILHHSIAYQVLNPDNVDAVNTGTGRGGPGANNATVEDRVNRRPQLMEWAIGKGYDQFMDGTGKLMLPGEKIAWDQHIHAAGEEITAGSELGIWLYPKGQEPKKRSYLIGFTGLKNGPGALDIPPNQVSHTEGFTVLRENTIITNFQPHFHLRGKAMHGRGDPAQRQHAGHQLRAGLQLQLDDQLHLRRRRGAGLPEGHDHPCDGVVRQHGEQQEQSGSEPVGRATATAPWTRWRTRG